MAFSICPVHCLLSKPVDSASASVPVHYVWHFTNLILTLTLTAVIRVPDSQVSMVESRTAVHAKSAVRNSETIQVSRS